jgi:hypothetical protein
MWRNVFYLISLLALVAVALTAPSSPKVLFALIAIVPLIALGAYDIASSHNVLSNYPVIGHLRYMMEFISPEIRQYFLEDDKSGRPFNRQQRDLVKARGRGESGTHPFGTEYDIEQPGYDFALHSIAVKELPDSAERVMVGGPLPTIASTAPTLSGKSARAILAAVPRPGASMTKTFAPKPATRW